MRCRQTQTLVPSVDDRRFPQQIASASVDGLLSVLKGGRIRLVTFQEHGCNDADSL